MSGDTWDDPIEITGTSGTFDIVVSASTTVHKVYRWSGAHVPWRPFTFTRTPAFGIGAQNYAYDGPAMGVGTGAAYGGTAYLADVAAQDVFDRDGDFYLRARAANLTGSPVTFTYSWSTGTPYPDRPYTWPEAQDVTADISAGSLTISYDNVAQGALESRFYYFTVADGSFVTVTPASAGSFIELYRMNSLDDWDGDYIAYAGVALESESASGFADGATTFMVYVDTGGITPPGVGQIDVIIQPPEPPPANVVTNDDVSSALPLSIAATSMSYDNTGASQDASAPGYLPDWMARTIWYDITPLASQRIIRFTPSPSSPDNPSLWPEMKIFAYGLSPSLPDKWMEVESAGGHGPGADAPLVAILPAGLPFKMVLSFSFGHPGQWETAGTLLIEDLTALLPPDGSPDSPSSLPYGGTVTFPDLGSLQVTRHMTFTVTEGGVYNLVTGSPTADPYAESFSAYVSVNGGSPIYIAARTAHQPTNPATQLSLVPGDVLTLRFSSAGGGLPLNFSFGASTEEDLNWSDWIPSVLPGDPVDAVAAPSDDRRSWQVEYTVQRTEGTIWPDADYSLHNALQAEAMAGALSSLAPTMGVVQGAVWGHSGYIFPSSFWWGAELTMRSKFAIVMPSISWSGAWDGSAIADDPAARKYAPVFRRWSLVLAQVPFASLGISPPSYPSGSQMISFFERGPLRIDWSNGAPQGKPYAAVVTAMNGGWTGVSGMSRFREVPTPNAEVPITGVYNNAAEIGVVRVDDLASLEAWMDSPAFGSGGVHAEPAPSVTPYSNAPTAPERAVFDAAWEDHPESHYITYCVGSQLSARTIMDGHDLRAACPFGFIDYSVSAGTANPDFRLELTYPESFRVGWYAERFGPPADSGAGVEPGRFLDPNPNLGGLPQGAVVEFS